MPKKLKQFPWGTILGYAGLAITLLSMAAGGVWKAATLTGELQHLTERTAKIEAYGAWESRLTKLETQMQYLSYGTNRDEAPSVLRSKKK